MALKIAGAQFYVLRYRHRFYGVPFKPVRGNFFLAGGDVFDTPNFSVRYLVQRRKHAFRAALGYEFQRDFVVVAIPSKTCL